MSDDHATDAFLDQQIKEYSRKAALGDEEASFRAAVLKSFVRQDVKMDNLDERTSRIEDQTKKTNGRVTKAEDELTKVWAKLSAGCSGACKELESRLQEMDNRMAAFEKPAKAVSMLWRAVGVVATPVVVVLGLLFAFMSTERGKDLFSDKNHKLEAAVEAISSKISAMEAAKQTK